MEFGGSFWYDYARGAEREWLIANGTGGYASLSVTGSNCRRYHGLLVAALKPPGDRYLLLSNVLEDLVFEDGSDISLSSFMTGDGYVNRGFDKLQRFRLNYLPEFVYSCGDMIIKKKIAMKHGENTVAVRYEIRNGAVKATFRLTPLVNFRDHHYLSRRDSLNLTAEVGRQEMTVSRGGSDVRLRMRTSGGQLRKLENCYFYNMFYPAEQERGLDCTEDHFMPGCFSLELEPFERKIFSFTATCEAFETGNEDAGEIIAAEERRLAELLARTGYTHELTGRLALAADSFIVRRDSTGAKTIIAGYPWFADWGRDTMIAFCGLTLATGRYGDAKKILYTFSKYVEHGLIPNMFPGGGEEPAYNSVDAALWYFEAVNSYLEYTGDYGFIEEKIYGRLEEICAAFMQGTIFDIAMSGDGLITAGNSHTQLTWMDARVGEWTVTPRHGKAVEINALWYNALMVMSALADKFGHTDIYKEVAGRARESFDAVFWNEEGGYLYDVVNEEGRDGSIRPNQILALGLSHPVVDGRKARAVVNVVWKKLYTPYGLRTLSQDSPRYRGIYTGDVLSRDGAYHQGTVWPWLLGRFVKAYVRVNGGQARAGRDALDFILPFADHIKDGGLGSISEILDGDSPHYPRGCFAQAWSVAEILRAAVEDVKIEDLEI